MQHFCQVSVSRDPLHTETNFALNLMFWAVMRQRSLADIFPYQLMILSPTFVQKYFLHVILFLLSGAALS